MNKAFFGERRLGRELQDPFVAVGIPAFHPRVVGKQFVEKRRGDILASLPEFTFRKVHDP